MYLTYMCASNSLTVCHLPAPKLNETNVTAKHLKLIFVNYKLEKIKYQVWRSV